MIALLLLLLPNIVSSFAITGSLEDFAAKSASPAGISTTLGNSGIASDYLSKESPKEPPADDEELKREAALRRARAKASGGSENIAISASERSPASHIKGHRMFDRSKKIISNPLSFIDPSCRDIQAGSEDLLARENYYITREDKAYEKKTCEKPHSKVTCQDILDVTCAQYQGCNSAGVRASDGSWNATYTTLTLRPYARGHREQIWYKAYGDTTIYIDNPEKLKSLKIRNIRYSGLLMISLSGRKIYHSYSSGDSLYVSSRSTSIFGSGFLKDMFGSPDQPVVYLDSRQSAYSSSDSGCCGGYESASLNFDLSPYGRDITLRYEQVYNSSSNLTIEVEVEQKKCCAKYADNWVKKCFGS